MTHEKIFELLRELHGDKLSIHNGENYYLFLKDAIVHLFFEEEDSSIVINVDLIEENSTFVYKSDVSLNDLTGAE